MHFKNLFRAMFLLAVFTPFRTAVLAVPAEESLVPFSFDNRQVNVAIISLYESQPTIWKKDQLYLIAMCLVAEGKIDTAQALFETIRGQDSSNARVLRALGNVHHMKGELDEATELFQQAWRESQDVLALKQLAVLKLQAKDFAGLEPLLPDLLEHQDESVDIQKVLLAYSVVADDLETGGSIYAKVARKLSKDIIEEEDDLKQLLLLATVRFHIASEAK